MFEVIVDVLDLLRFVLFDGFLEGGFLGLEEEQVLLGRALVLDEFGEVELVDIGTVLLLVLESFDDSSSADSSKKIVY